MNWDTGCENLFFHPDGPEFYPSLHVGGFKSRFNVANIPGDTPLLTDGVWVVPRQFRVYLPPGTMTANMNFFAPSGAKIGVAQRFKQTPQFNYCGVNALNFPVMPWSGHGVLADLEKKDRQIMNMGGGFFSLVQFFKTPGLSVGGWLYIKVLDVDEANDLFQFQYVVQVYRGPYLAWYNSPQTQWDALGDPLPLTGEIIVEPVQPVAVTLSGPATSEVVKPATYSAKGSGGTGQYEYRFWLKGEIGEWYSVQAYSKSNTWTWTPVKPGKFQVGVWIRTLGGQTPTDQHEGAIGIPTEVKGSLTNKVSVSVNGQQVFSGTLPFVIEVRQ
jgi:hypothetical protein